MKQSQERRAQRHIASKTRDQLMKWNQREEQRKTTTSTSSWNNSSLMARKPVVKLSLVKGRLAILHAGMVLPVCASSEFVLPEGEACDFCSL